MSKAGRLIAEINKIMRESEKELKEYKIKFASLEINVELEKVIENQNNILEFFSGCRNFTIEFLNLMTEKFGDKFIKKIKHPYLSKFQFVNLEELSKDEIRELVKTFKERCEAHISRLKYQLRNVFFFINKFKLPVASIRIHNVESIRVTFHVNSYHEDLAMQAMRHLGRELNIRLSSWVDNRLYNFYFNQTHVEFAMSLQVFSSVVHVMSRSMEEKDSNISHVSDLQRIEDALVANPGCRALMLHARHMWEIEGSKDVDGKRRIKNLLLNSKILIAEGLPLDAIDSSLPDLMKKKFDRHLSKLEKKRAVAQEMQVAALFQIASARANYQHRFEEANERPDIIKIFADFVGAMNPNNNGMKHFQSQFGKFSRSRFFLAEVAKKKILQPLQRIPRKMPIAVEAKVIPAAPANTALQRARQRALNSFSLLSTPAVPRTSLDRASQPAKAGSLPSIKPAKKNSK